VKYVFVLDSEAKDPSKLLSLDEGKLILFIPVQTEVLTSDLEEELKKKINAAEEIKTALGERIKCEIIVGWGESVESVLKREDAVLV
jgi:hypothetical protein